MQDGRKIAYDQHLGSSPALVYIHGLGGDMDEPPSTALGEYCRQRDISFLKFDLAGHGQSSGPFEDCTVSRWLDDIEFLINTLTSEHLILVGNDIGSWLMFLYTMRNPDRIFGLVGLATAADFTGLLWKQLSKVEKDEVKRTGFYSVGLGDGHPPVKLSLELIMDGEKHSILDMPG
jgi:pimeloyl-ACP methyl ester carboxylesterase